MKYEAKLGQGLAEYGLIAAVIIVAAVPVLNTLGNAVSQAIRTPLQGMSAASTAAGSGTGGGSEIDRGHGVL